MDRELVHWGGAGNMGALHLEDILTKFCRLALQKSNVA